jgi:hypothetical protein
MVEKGHLIVADSDDDDEQHTLAPLWRLFLSPCPPKHLTNYFDVPVSVRSSETCHRQQRSMRSSSAVDSVILTASSLVTTVHLNWLISFGGVGDGLISASNVVSLDI